GLRPAGELLAGADPDRVVEVDPGRRIAPRSTPPEMSDRRCRACAGPPDADRQPSVAMGRADCDERGRRGERVGATIRDPRPSLELARRASDRAFGVTLVVNLKRPVAHSPHNRSWA